MLSSTIFQCHLVNSRDIFLSGSSFWVFFFPSCLPETDTAKCWCAVLVHRVQLTVNLCKHIAFQKLLQSFHFLKCTYASTHSNDCNNKCPFKMTEISINPCQRMPQHILQVLWRSVGHLHGLVGNLSASLRARVPLPLCFSLCGRCKIHFALNVWMNEAVWLMHMNGSHKPH